jgi:membrane fusion protein, multidrug efflux system
MPVAQAPFAQVITIATESAATEQDFTASLQGKIEVEIRPQIEGFLQNVWVDEGAFVSAGQPLFKINAQIYNARLKSAAASLQAAEAAIFNTELEIEKLKPLVQNNVVSEYQLKAALAAKKMAVANAAQARAGLSAEKINLGYTIIKAPVSGYIGRILKKQGSLVSPGDVEALTKLSDVHEVYAYFSLGESDFIHFKSQNKGVSLNDKLKNLPAVSLILPDNTVYPRKGRIDMINGSFDKTTGAITLRAKFPNPENVLRSGNTGKIRLQQQHNDVILIPQSATMEMQDKIFVYLLGDSNKISRQPISVTAKTGTNYIIKDGVHPGDRIILSGLDHLTDGLIIRPENVKNNTKVTIGTY